jgi:hypothetical protein
LHYNLVWAAASLRDTLGRAPNVLEVIRRAEVMGQDEAVVAEALHELNGRKGQQVAAVARRGAA